MTAYDPETGDGDIDGDDIDVDVDDDIEVATSILADALDRTIVHAYNLSEDNADVRKLLQQARHQLSTMCGFEPAGNEVDRKLDEIRSEAGIGPVCSVSDGLRFLDSEGTAEYRLS
jgi:hypothetical protein